MAPISLRAVAVFCGSRSGSDPRHLADAAWFGQALVARGIGVVYGGASVGLMGALADAALAAGGRVVGVIPRFLVDKELAHRGLTELHVVETLHARKQKMAELADGFVALPGGIGTLDELFEIATWGSLGLHGKPIGLLDVRHYYADLLDFLDQGVADGFVDRAIWDAIQIADDPDHLLDVFQGVRPRYARDTDSSALLAPPVAAEGPVT
jgi:uncharacterized protein (TIGR00730 family)